MASPHILGVVGARSGSKSIPHKNIKPLLDKPLMGWIIEAAKRSSYNPRIILSTDSPEYQEVGRRFGAETPFLRPAEFSNDTATDMDYLTHAVKWLEENEGWNPDIILRLPPTTPLCKTETIDACIKLLLEDATATSSRAIATAPKHPYKLWKIEGDELLPFIPKEVTGFAEPSGMARQFYKPAAYAHIDVIAVRRDTLMNDGLLTGKRTRYHMLDKKDAIDIDTENDFLLAEIILKKKLGM
ncbi:MAG: acylneuraminate cytidylyltransferase family protein [bacterium]|nr:acylneuraminate cytidylyltransferase family protein [bacterium]